MGRVKGEGGGGGRRKEGTGAGEGEGRGSGGCSRLRGRGRQRVFPGLLNGGHNKDRKSGGNRAGEPGRERTLVKPVCFTQS